MWFAPADILLLFTQFFQFLLIRDLYRTARQLHHAFILEIAQPAGNNLAGIAHVVANDHMGGLSFVPSIDASSSRIAAKRLSKLFHII